MTRNLLNLGLLVIVLLLIAVVVWEPGHQPEVLSKLSMLETAAINRIQIQRDALQDMQLEKQDGHWQMLAPYKVAADESRVAALLSMLDTTSYVSFTAADRKPADYGLEPVLAQVQFNDSLFQFGSLEHISKRRYILAPGNTIHLATDLFYHQLRTSAAQFVSPRLFNETQRINRLQLADHQYEKKHDGSWLVAPDENKLSADKINEWIENWQRLRATRISPASETRGNEHINIELSDGTSPVFEILRSENEIIFIRRDLGLQYHVAKQTTEALLSRPKADALEKY